MYDCTATIWIDNTPTEFHLFPLPNFGDPHFYRTITCYEAFRKRENSGLYFSQKKARDTKTKWIPPAIRASMKDKDEWDVDHRILNESLAKYKCKTKPEPIWIRHDSLWDFFKAVGYDYKKKRYVRTENSAALFSATVEAQMSKALASFAEFATGAAEQCTWASRRTRHTLEYGSGWKGRIEIV